MSTSRDNTRTWMIKVFRVTLLVAYTLVGCSAPADPEASDATVASAAQALNTKAADAKVALCHLPPGDPKARHTITVSASAVSSHLAHGDTLDECPTGCTNESCDDGEPCTVDVCLDYGACSHSAVNCDDGNPCTVDLCTAGVGCTSAPAPGTLACNDGNDCTAGDTCANGACRGQAIAGCCLFDTDCADASLCTNDRCVNHACANSPVMCTVADLCLAAFCDPAVGACDTTPVTCDDGNACTDDACDPASGCTHQPTANPPEAVEVSCSDGIDNDCDGARDVDDPDCFNCGDGVLEPGEPCDGEHLRPDSTCEVLLGSDYTGYPYCSGACTLMTDRCFLKTAPESFGLGNGATPAPALVAGLNVVNSYASVGQVNPASVVSLDAAGAAAFAPANNGGRNVLAMIWVVKRLAAVPDVGSPFNLDPTATGAWELARVSSVFGTTINFVNPLVGSYPAGAIPTGDIQIILVPEFVSLTVDAGQAIVPKTWDGSSGGVVAMLVQGALTINGIIDATGRGFAGGLHGGFFTTSSPFPNCTISSEGSTDGSAGTKGGNHSSSQGTGRKYLANGGGGGLCLDTGGGGGGNGGRGGDGDSSGVGTGTALPGHGGGQLDYSPLTHFSFGGGGGAGQLSYLPLDPTQADGAAGGGAVFIRAGVVAGSGAIHADGADAGGGLIDDVGHGGGGGGGTVIVRVGGATSICASITAAGGRGGTGTSNSGRGGGGGGGHVYVQANPPCNAASVQGGAKGGGGATSGANGQVDTTPLGPYCTTDANCAGITGRNVCNAADNSCVQVSGG